jgi:hypothetical protein
MCIFLCAYVVQNLEFNQNDSRRVLCAFLSSPNDSFTEIIFHTSETGMLQTGIR